MTKIDGVNLYSKFLKLRKLIDAVTERLAVFFTILMVAAVSFQVIYRFIIVKFVSFSFPFTEEIASYLMIWTTYLLLGVCFKEGMHVAVNILSNLLSRKNKLLLYFILRVMMSGFIIVILFSGTDLVLHSFIFKSPTLGLPLSFLYLAPVTGSVLLIFYIIVEALGLVTSDKDPFTANRSED